MLELKKNIIYKTLKDRITSGAYKTGTKMPSEIIFSKELNCSRKTLRYALTELETGKFIERIRPNGTFVLPLGKTRRSILLLTCGGQELSAPYTYILPKLEQFAREKEFDTEIQFIPLFKNLELSAMKRLIEEKNIHAILLCTSFLQSQDFDCMINSLKKLKIPVLIPSGHSSDFQYTGFPMIKSREKRAIKIALDHLLELGHRNITTLCIKNPSDGIRGYKEEEYRELLHSKGCKLNGKELYFASYSDDNEIEKAVLSSMDGENPATAILCFSDFFAIKVYDVLEKYSFKIPEDVSVVGLCGYPGGEFLVPSLTTVDFCYEQIAKITMKAVAESSLWYGKNAKKQFEISYSNVRLIKRDSAIRLQKGRKTKQKSKFLTEPVNN